MLIRQPVLGLFLFGKDERAGAVHVAVQREVDLRHHHNLIPREVVLLDGFPEDDFGEAVAVGVGGIKGVDAEVISKLDLLDAYSDVGKATVSNERPLVGAGRSHPLLR